MRGEGGREGGRSEGRGRGEAGRGRKYLKNRASASTAI